MERFISVIWHICCAMMQQLIKRKAEKPTIEEVERLLAEIHRDPSLLKKAKRFTESIGSKA